MQKVNIDKNKVMLESTKLSRNMYEFFKRLMDIICSIFALIILAPILLLVAVLIKLESKGPVIFAQERVGLNNKLFKMYKFRSMVANAEELKKKLEDQNELGRASCRERV